MDVKKVISALQEKKEFKDWHEQNLDAKLVHVFMMIEQGKAVNLDIGFYDFSKELMTSFLVDEAVSSVKITESKEIFTTDTGKIKPLDENKMAVTFDEALKISLELQKNKYKQHVPVKEIVVLQNLEIGQVWNITFITKQFQTLNIKVDSASGKVVEDKLHEIFSFDK